MLLVCVLITCLSVGVQASPEPNHASSAIIANDAAQVVSPLDVNKPAPKGEQPKPPTETNRPHLHRTQVVPWIIAGTGVIVAAAGFGFGLFQYRRRKADARIKKVGELEGAADFQRSQVQQVMQTAEEKYRSILREELGVTQVLGTHEIANVPVDLLETFVSLSISAACETGDGRDLARSAMPHEDLRALTPEAVVKRAFERQRMLLILGDAGSGKTTLLKYYAMLCLKRERHGELGFTAAPLPMYLPLRDIDFEGDTPRLLHECLSTWAKKHYKEISPDVFHDWLDHRHTLILLDGLDEISDLEKRRRVCEWIDNAARSLGSAHLIITSRWTGYRKLDQIQLGVGHLAAEIRDFSHEQQAQFLRKWFVAASVKEARDESMPHAEWEARQRQWGLDRAQAIIDYLALDQNRVVRELVAVPMLLQVVAIIWREHENLPQNRAELYKTALNYLVYYRERHRHLEPPLRLDHALRALRQAAFWMQDELASDDVQKEALHRRMQPVIRTMNDTLSAAEYCEYLRDRAAVLADCGDDCYVFRHKSFREYLAGVELVEVCKDPQRLKQVAEHLGDDWWEEPLRFLMGEVDDRLFDGLMNAIFRSEVSRELDQKTYNLLLTLVGEASQRRIDSLVRCLKDRRLHDNKKRYIVDCLKTIGTREALEAVEEFARTAPAGAAAAVAQEVVARQERFVDASAQASLRLRASASLSVSFRNPFELNAEYIRISGGSFEYSVTKKVETVPDLYFAKYPVTNQRYRLFVSYLAGREARLAEVLPHAAFAEGLRASAAQVEGFRKYLGGDPGSWVQKLRSEKDEEKRFKGDEQPVVGVSWFDASAYCLWLSLLEAAAQGVAPEKFRRVYGLPREVGWEWAAAGRAPGGGLREYPWPAEKGKPTDKLANYGGNVGATTPVGRYPEGVTPEGLMDMAGNVWEWMENWHEEYTGRARSLRGGSWSYSEGSLRCSARLCYGPEGRLVNLGFRVVCSQS